MNYYELVIDKAKQYGIPVEYALKWVQKESRFDESAVSEDGAVGLTQVLPSTAAKPGYGVDPMDPKLLTDPEANVDFGMRYLKAMHDRTGDWGLAFAAYNAGPSRVLDSREIPDIYETKDYVSTILTGDLPEGSLGAASLNRPEEQGPSLLDGVGVEEEASLDVEGLRSRLSELGRGDRALRGLAAASKMLAAANKPARMQEMPVARMRRGEARDPLSRFGIGSLRG